MKMKHPFKVGQRVFDRCNGHVATVTAHTDRGFKYKFDVPVNMGARIGIGIGGECYEGGYKSWEKFTGKNKLLAPQSFYAFTSHCTKVEQSKAVLQKRDEELESALQAAWKNPSKKNISAANEAAQRPIYTGNSTAATDCTPATFALRSKLDRRCVAFVRRLARLPCKAAITCNCEDCISCQARRVLQKKP